MKSKFLVGSLIFLSFNSNAQHQLSYSINGGVSKMKSIPITDNPFSQTKFESLYRPSFNTGFNYSLFHKDFFIETGLNYNLVQGRGTETWSEFLISSTDIVVEKTSQTERRAHYLSIPLVLNYKLDKIVSIGVGLSTSFLLTDSYYNKTSAHNMTLAISGGGNYLSKFDFGLNTNIKFLLSDKLSAQISYYHGLSDVSNNSERSILYNLYQIESEKRQLKNSQVTIGLNYQIFKQ